MFVNFDKVDKKATVLVERGNESVRLEIKTEDSGLTIAVAYGEVFIERNGEYHGNSYDIVDVKGWLNKLLGEKYHPAIDFVARIVSHEIEVFKRGASR